MASKIKYEAGEHIGNAQLVERIHQDKWRTWWWTWICLSCGSLNGPSSLQKVKQTNYCRKCYNLGERNPRWLGYREITGTKIWELKYSAQIRELEWNITPAQMWEQWEKQEGKCAYTGLQLSHRIDASLDRIDSQQGYLVDNIQWVHRYINQMKMNLKETIFIDMCQAVTNYKC